jgi:protein gp37
LYQLIEQTPFLDWLLVTKRPDNYSQFLPQSWLSNPKPNVWLMTTCENQECTDKRIPELMKVPAVVYGISVEPMLGPITLPKQFLNLGRSGWVIAGGESGSSARPTSKKWLTDLRDQCVSHGVAYFFKKWGKFHPNGNNVLVKLSKAVKDENPRVEHVLDGREWNELPAPNQSYLEKRDQILYECASEL